MNLLLSWSPDYYKIGYVRSMGAYGIEFKEGPDGFGVHASKDVEPLRRARTDWDLRLACLLLYALDRDDNFWQLYGDFLPSADECTSLLLANEVPTIDQDTAIAGPEPNETLMKVRSDMVLRPDKKQQGKVNFGQNLVCKESLAEGKPKMVKAGDPIYVINKVPTVTDVAA
ncbi:Molybdenum cofactor sulfurase family protein isoform 1 [Hibiscus syriacus]|uniref:Molybdenum cofactor sulfurase family protein isoform 1 n=1 Tax=Hibiscus syriacus TaxID=106335 RepID=A0A6A2XZ86_HIBSY|nr:Molybdenum cofactor sulfurase family protein isoform 1 [Hibiscus syriacus]